MLLNPRAPPYASDGVFATCQPRAPGIVPALSLRARHRLPWIGSGVWLGMRFRPDPFHAGRECSVKFRLPVME